MTRLAWLVVFIAIGCVDAAPTAKSGDMLVLETKGQPDKQSQSKRRALEQWARAVNQQRGFGHWFSAVSYEPGNIKDILAKQDQADVGVRGLNTA